jgi:hypothetical protein
MSGALRIVLALTLASVALGDSPSTPAEIPSGAAASCGNSPSLLYELNEQANSPATFKGGTMMPFTDQKDFPASKVVTCGKFRLYYEDFLQTPSNGFDAPGVGAQRQKTLCAVLNYVENTLSINVNGTTEFVDLQIRQSWSPSNPAPAGTKYLAIAGPYFNKAMGYGVTPGFYAGNVMLHATFGSDPEKDQYDGLILVNFDGYSYMDDYQLSNSCGYDLYSVLLHEVTHTLGFLSNVRDNAGFAECGAMNNSFTKFDWLFLYHGDPCDPPSLKKVVSNSPPMINPAVGSQKDALTSNRIWLRNGPLEQNHPAYSGTLPAVPLILDSVCSHLSGVLLSFTSMSQYAPGFQPNYVMGPTFGKAQRKREWTLAEIRALLTLGYGLNPAFGASKSLNGKDVNSWLLSKNSPAHRTNCSQPVLAWGAPVDFMEKLPADFPPLKNENSVSKPKTTKLTINLPSLANIADAQGDTIVMMPGSLFGIRGVSGNANDHAAISQLSKTQLVYTPPPGFHGRAQFGFYLWDGHERGALRIVSIDVVPGSNVVTPGDQLVFNPGLEDGTEVRQRALKPDIPNSPNFDFAYESVFAGKIFSGGHPFNWEENNWTFGGGAVVQNSWYDCDSAMVPDGKNGYYGFWWTDWNLDGYGPAKHPKPPPAPSPNERYHHLRGPWNYSTLVNEVTGCRVYKFESDLNFEKSGYAVGQTFTFQLQFVNNPWPGHHTELHYTVPVNVKIATVAPNAWQHVTFDFQYCGHSTYYMNLVPQGVLANPPVVVSGKGGVVLTDKFTPSYDNVFIDNISLRQVVPTPALTLSTTVSQAPGNCALTPATLTGLPLPYIPCNATYEWQPGNLSGTTVTVMPTTSTYTLTAKSGCLPAATASVTVNANAGNNVATGWPKHPTGSGREFLHALTTMPNGDVVAAGVFDKDESFPGFAPFVTSANRQLAVYRFNETCGTKWAVALGHPTGDESVSDIVADESGTIFMTGAISTTTTFGSFTLPGPAAYILALDGSSGAVVAAQSSSVGAGSAGYRLALYKGNVYVTGQFLGTLHFGSLPTLTSNGASDVFVAGLDSALVPLWNIGFGSKESDTPGGLGLSSVGSLYVAANIGGNLNIGTNTFTNAGAGTTDVFIGRFSSGSGGYFNGSGRMEGNAAANCAVNDMTMDAAGDIYFTGSFEGSFDTLSSTSEDAYIASWKKPALADKWIRRIGGGGKDKGNALTLDGAGNVYGTGQFMGTASLPGFAPSTLPGAAPITTNAYVVKLTSGGVPAWAAGSFATQQAVGLAVTALPSGSSFVAGDFLDTVSFGSAPLAANMNVDCFVARLSASGAFQ